MRENWPKLISRLPKQLTFSQAANILLLPYGTVRDNLKRHGYEHRDGRSLRWVFRKARSKVPVDTCDWTRSNVVLAKKYGVSREYIRRLREHLGIPKVGGRGIRI